MRVVVQGVNKKSRANEISGCSKQMPNTWTMVSYPFTAHLH